MLCSELVDILDVLAESGKSYEKEHLSALLGVPELIKEFSDPWCEALMNEYSDSESEKSPISFICPCGGFVNLGLHKINTKKLLSNCKITYYISNVT